MKNPFKRRKKEELISIVPDEIISNSPSMAVPISPSVAVPIISRPSILTTISNGGSMGSGVWGIMSPNGIQGSTGSSGWGYASAATFTYMDPNEVMERRKKELMKEYEQNPELFSEIIVELRRQKIKQLKENAKTT